jgi:hypothetical protein
MKELKLFYYRNFKVLTKAQALEFDLDFRYNLYGDEINLWNCRSIWKDHKGRIYRVNKSL